MRAIRTHKAASPVPPYKQHTDPRFPECKLVPVTKASYVKVGGEVPPNTYYRVITKTDKLRCFVTIAADGTHLAWDTCGACHQHCTTCKCGHGVLHPDSIEWCVRKSAGWYAGEPIDFPVHMDEYSKKRRIGGSFKNINAPETAPKAPRRAKASYYPDDDLPPVRRPSVPSQGVPDTPVRTIRTRTGSKQAETVETMADIDAAAGSIEQELADQIVSSGSKTDKKPRTFRIKRKGVSG